MKRIIYISIVLFLLTACSQSKVNSNNKILFDLNTLVQQDIDSLQKNNCGCTKTILAVDKKEIAIQDTINWEKEMQLILSCDINKPKWIEHFKVDSLDNKVLYTTQNNKIPIKKMVVYYNEQQEVVQVEIKKQQKSILLKNVTYVNYYPKKGFEVKQEQYLPLNKPFIFMVEEKYKCN